LVQPDGTHLPHTTHLTITPVTEQRIDELEAALRGAADEVRGVPRADPAAVLAALPPGLTDAPLDSDTAAGILQAIGLGGSSDTTGARLPEEMSLFLALIEALPHPVTERLLVELLARIVEPAAD
jgi:hypothetical protein